MGNIINKVDSFQTLNLDNIKTLHPAYTKIRNEKIKEVNLPSQTFSANNYTPEYTEMMILSGDASQMAMASSSIDTSGLATAGATVVTTLGGLLNGVANFGEDLVDFAVILASAGNSASTIVVDAGSYLLTGQSLGLTEQMWGNTMAFVEEGHVDNFFNWFYNDTEAGKVINENALEVMQYGNTGYNVANTVGYLGGEIALTVATAGIGAGAAGTLTSANLARTGAGVGFSAGTGRSTSNAWNSGATLTEGLTYGLASGAWEGAQWAVGGAWAGRGARAVLVDIGSGFGEVPVNSLLEGIYSDEDLATRFENNGGMQGVITNMALAGILSGAGEWTALKNNDNRIAVRYSARRAQGMAGLGFGVYERAFDTLGHIRLKPKEALYTTESGISLDNN